MMQHDGMSSYYRLVYSAVSGFDLATKLLGLAHCILSGSVSLVSMVLMLGFISTIFL